MARLGRRRRSKTVMLRAPSQTTATPLVRKRVLVEQDGANGMWRWLAHSKRQRRGRALTLRAPIIQPPPPVIRNRVRVTANALRPAVRRAHWWRHRQLVIKAPLAPLRRPSKPLVAGLPRRPGRVRYFRRHPVKFLHSLLGTAGAVSPIIVGQFDPPVLGVNLDPSSPDMNEYDPPTPGQVIV